MSQDSMVSRPYVLENGVLPLRIDQTPFAIVDFETTGLYASGDRVVEVAVRRFEPKTGTVVAFDTLVNPERPMGATQQHGIREEDVRNAPTFGEVAPKIIDHLSGAVFASYNVSYDARFLRFELSRIGIDAAFPQVCLMLLKPLLGLGSRCGLVDACSELGVGFEGDAHVAADDAEAAERLLRRYLDEFAARDLITFADLRSLGNYEFLGTLVHTPLPTATHFAISGTKRSVSRSSWPVERRTLPGQAALKRYFDALVAVMRDFVITHAELVYMKRLQEELRLTPEQIRALHGRAFLCVMMNFIGDDWLDDAELSQLDQASSCLAKLGWTPGAQ